MSIPLNWQSGHSILFKMAIWPSPLLLRILNEGSCMDLRFTSKTLVLRTKFY